MRQLSSLLNGLAKSLYAGKRKVPGVEEGREAADELRREAKKNDTILRSSGTTRSCVSVFSQRGEKGVNQDCSIVWEVLLRSHIYFMRSLCILVCVLLLLACFGDCFLLHLEFMLHLPL